MLSMFGVNNFILKVFHIILTVVGSCFKSFLKLLLINIFMTSRYYITKKKVYAFFKFCLTERQQK